MYGTKRILAITFARAGSKGVPGKNLRHVAGKPLIAHSIDVGLESRYIDRLMMTTDGPDIARVARRHGAEVPFLRPSELAQDNTPALPVLRHATRWMAEREGWSFDAVVTLEPTTPMRTATMLDEAIEAFFDQDADCLVGVRPVNESPCWMFTIDMEGELRPLMDVGGVVTSRQSLPPVFSASGSVFINRAEQFLARGRPDNVPLWELGHKVVPFVVHDPIAGIDLDSELDFAVLETLLTQRALRPTG